MKLRYYQSGGKPTTQDSLQLLENSNQVRKYYNNPKYKNDQKGRPIFYYDDNNEFNWLHQRNFDELRDFLKEPVATTNEGYHGKIPISSYYQNVDKNKYKQREIQNQILDLRAPMQLYDRRINPTYIARYENIDVNDSLHDDQVDIATYPKLQVTPINQLTRAERIERQKAFGVNPGETNYIEQPKEQPQPKKTITRTTKFVPIPKSDTTRKPIVTNNPNDPKLKAYRDSLNLYKTYQRELVTDNYGYKPGDFNEKVYKKGTKEYEETLNFTKERWGRKEHSTIEPIAVFETGEYPFTGLRKYMKPIQPITYQPGLTKLTPKGLPTTELPAPQMRRMPDRIERDSRTGAEYKGLKVSHYTDGLGRYTAKLNLTTGPTQGRISYREGGIINYINK